MHEKNNALSRFYSNKLFDKNILGLIKKYTNKIHTEVFGEISSENKHVSRVMLKFIEDFKDVLSGFKIKNMTVKGYFFGIFPKMYKFDIYVIDIYVSDILSVCIICDKNIIYSDTTEK